MSRAREDISLNYRQGKQYGKAKTNVTNSSALPPISSALQSFGVPSNDTYYRTYSN